MFGSSPIKAQPPLGRRPPKIDITPIFVRGALLIVVLLISFPQQIEALAQGAQRTHALAKAPVIGILLHGLASSRVQDILHLVVAAGLTAFALELANAAVRLVAHNRAILRMGGVYLRIRTPRESTSAVGQKAAPHAGVDFFRAIHAILPAKEAGVAGAPYLALTLMGKPNEPTELGAFVSDGGVPAKGAVWAAALREVLSGQAPDTLVETTQDPLLAAVQPGMGIAWREFGLVHHPSYPLRLGDDIERSDLLGPLIAALRCGAGVAHTESQLIIRPRRDVDLTQGWRAIGMRRLIKMKTSSDYALAPDVATLEDKLHVPAYDVTLRLVAVAIDGRHRAAATAELDEAAAVIGQYAARSGRRLQKLKPMSGGYLRVRHHAPSVYTAAQGYLLAAVIAAVLVVLTLHTPTLPVLAAVFPIPAAVARWFPLALRILAPLFVGLVVARLVQQRHDIPAWVRIRRLVRRAPRALPPSPFLTPVALWHRAAILAPLELGGLWHLPTPALAHLVRWLPNRLLPAPAHAFIPAGAADRIVLGHARQSDGTLKPVGPTPRDLRYILHFTAGVGAGKSRQLANISQQFLTAGQTIVDGKADDAGNLTATVLDLIPEADEARVVIADILDMEWPFGINPLAGIDLTAPGRIDLALGQISAVFARLDPETWSKAPTMKQLLEMSMRLVAEGETHPTLAHGKQALIDAAYRAKLLPYLTNLEVRTYWEVTFPEIGEATKNSLQALLRRFDMLLVPEVTRYLITQATPTIDFLSCIESQRIVLIPLPHVTLGSLSNAIGTLLFQSFVRASFSRRGTDQTRATYPLIVDEFQVLVENGDPTDVEYAISQLRALGIAAIYTNQALKQLGDSKDLLLINAANRIVLQTEEPDASEYAKKYASSGVAAADVSGQEPNDHQYAAFRVGGTPTGLFSLRPLPWPTPIAPDVSAYAGPAWQRVLPADADPSDPWVLALIYQTPENMASTVQELAAFCVEEWAHLNDRWEAIRQTQRAYILAHRGCIPDRVERLRWLSRLDCRRPRVLAAAEYARTRRSVGVTEPVPVAPARRTKQDASPFARAAVMPASTAYIPGIAPEAAPPAPEIAAGLTLEQALRERGRRPSREALIAAGFDGLRTSEGQKGDGA